MPKSVGIRKKTDGELIESFGLNFTQIKILTDAHPKQAIGALLHGFAKFLIAGDSRDELKWRSFGPPLIEREFGERIAWIGHNSMIFSLPGATYKPDFDYMLDGGRMLFVEVKASKMQPGYRDARSKLVCAATLYPMFSFYEARKDKDSADGWVFEKIKPDPNYANVFISLEAAHA